MANSRPSALRTCRASGKSSTNASCRALVVPSKKMPRPDVTVSQPADVERVGQTFAERRAGPAFCFHLFEDGQARQIERLESHAPQSELHGDLVDGGEAKRHQDVKDQWRDDGSDFANVYRQDNA